MSNAAALSQSNGLEIAVIGMSGRFPGSRTVEQFWRNVRDGVESITFFSDRELEASGHDAAELRDPNYVKARGVLEEIEMFDASFFGFSPREAEIADPQQRFMLECAWEALESGGYYPATYQGRIGVYAGVSISTYLLVELLSNSELRKSTTALQLLLGNDKDHLATRISYKLNLKGPSVTVQTSCSTSLVAVHLACQSLLSGECDIALAGGASIGVPHRVGYYYQEGGILSPDGHCRAFDARGQGTVSGSGAGIVALKRLADALSDGDCIRAVIKGSAINNDGSLKVGYTAPSETGQIEAIRAAQFMAEVEPETITYIEAHGTATALGDPIEIKALTQAFRAATDKKNFCAIGSVKTNIGHLDAGAGIAGLIKTTLALEHKEIPPSLHFEKPNPKIDFAHSPFFVNTNLTPWETNGSPRRAGVSSFGIGGTNAHVIIEEAPACEPAGKGRDWQLLVFSAKTETALETLTLQLVEHLKQHPRLNFHDVAHTLQVGRGSFKHRRMLACRDAEDAISALGQTDARRSVDAFRETQHRPVVFMFPGQGTQYVNMAAELYSSEPVFRKHIDACCELLEPHLKLDLRQLLMPRAERAADAARELEQTCFTQPALFVVEYALAQMWMDWGIRPQAFIGHSIGEYVAACLAGVFTLEDALRLVAARGRMIQSLAGGAMLAVPLSEGEVLPLLGDQLSLAAVNGASSCVVSGSEEAIEELQERLNESGQSSRRLHTSHAFHSALMNPIIESFTAQVRAVRLNPPQIPYLSNVTGDWMTAHEATAPTYWAKHLRQTVRFADGLSKLLKDPDNVLLETGPGTTLTTLARRHPERAEALVTIATLPHPRGGEPDAEFVTKSLGQLWLAGVEIDWTAYHAGEQRRRLPLPTYPFERQRYWISSRKQAQTTNTTQASPVNAKAPDDWFYIPLWKEAASAPASNVETKATGEESIWLAFIDEGQLGQQLVESLERRGCAVVCVKIGEHFSKLGERSYVINPARANDYDALFHELSATPPAKILHLWNLTQPASVQAQRELSDSAGSRGLTSLLHIAQALQKLGDGRRVRVEVVSNNAQRVTGDEQLCTLKAALAGVCKAISREFPRASCRSIDITLPEAGDASGQELIERRLLAEIISEGGETNVAFRDGDRWVQSFKPVRLKLQPNTPPARLRVGGTYLVTCGADGLGYDVAEYLARKTRARTVLVEDAPVAASSRASMLHENGNGARKNAESGGANIEARAASGARSEVDYISQLEMRIEREFEFKETARLKAFEPKADRLCASYILDYFETNGIEIERGKSYERRELKNRLNLLPKFDRFYDYMVRVLAEDQLIKADNGTIEFLRHEGADNKSKQLKLLLDESHPEFTGALQLLDHCVNHYSNGLTGKVEAISILYPDGNPNFIDNHLKNSLVYSNTAACMTLAREMILRALEDARGGKLRILEVGGGNGYFTRFIAPMLVGRNVEYHFTDLGASFAIRAEHEAAKHGLDCMKFGTFDISQDPLAQGFEAGRYDLIVGCNVVHATSNIKATLGNLRKLLTSQGKLLLVELIKMQRWEAMVWALAEGLWNWDDGDLRTVSPLLTLEQWKAALESSDFENVYLYPRDASNRPDSNHGLIVAHAGGATCAVEATALEARDERRARALCEIEKLGGEVLHVNADVSDRAQMKEALNQASARFGQLNGVIHTSALPCASGNGDGSTGGGDANSLTCELDSIISGAQVLYELTEDAPERDFFLLFSPSGAIDGKLARISRSAAGASFDAFADARFAAGDDRIVSINWDTDDATREAPGGPSAMTRTERLESLERILSSSLSSHVVVSKRDLAATARVEIQTSFREEKRAHAVESSGSQTEHRRPALSNNYVAARTPNERIITEMWQDLLGIKQVGAQDNFFQLGGDSLLALQLVSKLRQRFNVELSHHAFLEAATVAEVAALIGTNSTEEAGDKSVRAHSSVLVEIQRGDSQPPLVLVPPSGGNLYLYQDLVRRLGQQQTVFGMQPKGLDGDEEPFTNLQELASYYLEALREAQPTGPYLLGGASFGGAVAFEMSRQLEAQNQKVALLALFDTPAPHQVKARDGDENAFLNALINEVAPDALAKFRQLAPADRLAFVVEQLKQAQKLPAHVELQLATRILHVWRCDLEALSRYAPETYGGRALFFRARERDRGLPQYPEQPWIEMAGGGLEVHVVPGGHYTMFAPPHVESLAARFQAHLAEATRSI
jgi:acyl transferase domain-containing protein/thioesterase domain-containing protein/acyl carrier protein/2-polyprenyl-3-methyl-5-hydroxy-6-metoxy-1,4-benzoquinol methylase